MIDIPPILHEVLAGRYVLKREIGRGGAATVYLAQDLRHERLVAIKVLHPELSHALGAQRFLREIKLTASLQHPHILAIHDSGEAQDQLYYVMPYVEGDSLRARLGSYNPLSLEEAVRIGREVAGALAFAHEHGVVHRDIKPENILFSGGHAVLADFGIARAINRAAEKITQQGTITGTPAYMSPEQARDRAFDGRSDVYSLACVLYEAIAGVPPFVGDTPQQLLTQRISRTPPLLREYRYDVPKPIEAVIAKALSTSPDDRFDDARAFSAALSAAIGNSGETLTMRVARRPLMRSPWLWAAGVTVMVAGAAATSPQGREQIDVLTGRVDTAQYAIVPFQYVGAPSPADDQEPVAQGLYAAMREWKGLKLASDVGVIDAMNRMSDSSLHGVFAVARRAHAGKLVWGRVWMTRDSMRVRAGVYDVVEGTSLREVTVVGARDLLQARPGALRLLAADLLRSEGTPASARAGDVGTRSFGAWQAYQEGQRYLAAWRVRDAMAAFERATVADADYANAHLWLGQLKSWRGLPRSMWGPHAGTALRNRASLDERESKLVDALHAMQLGKYADACRSYDELRARDSLDATAWLGLVQCRTQDKIVLPSARSSTGWAFRGSFAAAQRDYARVLQIAPGAFGALPYNTITRLFEIQSTRYRHGITADSAPYFALPDLSGDSVIYLPRPFAKLNAISFNVAAPGYERALQRNRDRLLGLLSTLTQRMPDDPNAFEALALVLEAGDEITGTPNGGHSALSALDRAKALATEPLQRVRLGAADVRLHLKLGDFARAAAIGDSVLAAMPTAAGESAAELAGVAALLGREGVATTYLRASGLSTMVAGAPSVPLLEDVGTALFMRAALGVCDDSLHALQKRVTVLLDSYVSDAQRDAARRGLTMRPAQFAVGCDGASTTLGLSDPTPTVQALQTFARGDRQRARSQLDSMQRARHQLRPGDFALDYTITEAWLRVALGDTASATRQLDLTLTALPTLSPFIVYEPGMAAAVGRAMVYRAQLAAKRRDPGTAALWASRVLTLWAKADQSLAPTLTQMRSLAAHRS